LKSEKVWKSYFYKGSKKMGSKMFDPKILAEMTPEQREALEKFEQAEERAAGSLISLEWMATEIGSRYVMNKTNAATMRNWICEYGNPKGEWSKANLDAAMLATEHEHVLQDPVEPVVEVPPEPPPQPKPFDYGPWANLTVDVVKKLIAAGQYRAAMHDPRFVKKVDELKISRAELFGKG
jgi:hypothetical protein